MMKHLLKRTGAILVSCCLMAGLMIQPATAADPTISIGDQPYTTIEEALTNAKTGETITLSAGTFTVDEQLVVDKELTIEGAGKAETIIQFNGTSSPASATYASSVTVYPIVKATASLTMNGLTVNGPISGHFGLDGIFATDDLSLTDVAVKDIRSTVPESEFTGDQWGRAIVAEGGEVTLDKVDVIHYQKNAVDTKGATLTATDSTFQGFGEQDIMAQNGIVLRESQAVLTGNTLKDMKYTAENEWKGGSIGVYLLGATSTAELAGNTISGLDNAYYGDEGATFTFTGANTLENTTNEYEGTNAATSVKTVWSVTLNKTELTLDEGANETLTATVAPEDAADKAITWSTSDDKVATVKDGKVTAVAAGTATITATAPNGVKAECAVTVNKKNVPATAVALNKTALTLEVGKNETLTATMTPADSTDTITWTTSDDKVATVKDGKVTAVAKGTAKITATATSGVKAECTVTVNDPEIIVDVVPQEPDSTVPEKDVEEANKIILDMQVENLESAVKSDKIDEAINAGKDVTIELKVNVATGTKLTDLKENESPVLVFEAAPYLTIDGNSERISNEDINGNVTLLLPLTEGFPTENLIVIHKSEGKPDQTLTPEIVTIEGAKYAKITVSHFSTFTLMQKPDENSSVPSVDTPTSSETTLASNPPVDDPSDITESEETTTPSNSDNIDKTGDSNAPFWALLALIVAAAGMTAFVVLKRRKTDAE